MTGTVADVHKLGDRWRAELSAGGDTVIVNGLAGARIPATTIVEGRRATVVGIVRRPYPGASDRRWSVVPRGTADVEIGGPGSSGGSKTTASGSGTGGSRGSGGFGSRRGRECGTASPTSISSTIADHVGQTVRVGGLVEELVPDGFLLERRDRHRAASS